MPESFERDVPQGSKAPRVYGKRNPDAVIEARQRRLYRKQLDGLPARHLVLEHMERENISYATAWKDWKKVQEWTDSDFQEERATLVSRLQHMRMRAIEKALRKGQISSAAMLMDSLGKVLGEAENLTGEESVKLNIQIEKKQ